MQLLTQWLGALGGIVPFVLLFGLVIGIHELGHYLVARWCGIRAATFSIGIGPEIAGLVDRHGTRWRIACLPLGGYVRFATEAQAEATSDSQDGPKEHAKDALELAPVWQRSLVVAAGPFANFLLAVVLFAFVFMAYGKRVDALRIDTIAPGSAIAVAGLKPADVIAVVDGRRIESRAQFETFIAASGNRPIVVRVERRGAPVELQLGSWNDPQTLESLGVVKATMVRNARLQRFDPAAALILAVRDTSVMSVIFVRETAVALWRLLPGMGNSDLGGPLALVQSSSQAAAAGLSSLLLFAAVFSIAIGAFNMLPIPPLDGGRLMLYALEAAFARIPGKAPQIARMAANGLMIAGVLVVILIFVTLITGDVLALARKAWS